MAFEEVTKSREVSPPLSDVSCTGSGQVDKKRSVESDLDDGNEKIKRVRGELQTYLEHLSKDGVYLGKRMPALEDYSIRDKAFLKVHTVESNLAICLTILLPNLRLMYKEILPDNPDYTREGVKRILEELNCKVHQEFNKYLKVLPIVEEFSVDRLQAPEYYQIVLNAKGVDAQAYYSLPVFEEGVKRVGAMISVEPFVNFFNNSFADRVSLERKRASELEKLLKEKTVVWCNPEKFKEHFSKSETTTIHSNDDFSVITLMYKERVDGEIFRIQFPPRDLLWQLREIQDFQDYQKRTGKKYCPKFETSRINPFLLKLTSSEALQQTYSDSDPKRLRKGSIPNLDATVWRFQFGDFVILPSQMKTKRFSSGTFKAASLAFEITKGVRPTAFVWCTAIIVDQLHRDVFHREVRELEQNAKYSELGAHFLLKLRFASPEYQANAKHRGGKGMVSKMGIMTEFCDLGVFKYSQVSRFSMKTRLILFKQLLLATKVLHDHNRVHRDIKPGNVFLKSNAEGEPEIRLSDFGSTVNLYSPEILTTYCYLQFELLSKMLKAEGHNQELKNGPQTDIYSLGRVAFETLLGKSGISLSDNPKDIYDQLFSKYKNGESTTGIDPKDLEKSKFLRLVQRMCHTHFDKIPKSIDEVLLLLDEVLEDGDEIEFLDTFSNSQITS